jgi:hypothetical protein
MWQVDKTTLQFRAAILKNTRLNTVVLSNYENWQLLHDALKCCVPCHRKRSAEVVLLWAGARQYSHFFTRFRRPPGRPELKLRELIASSATSYSCTRFPGSRSNLRVSFMTLRKPSSGVNAILQKAAILFRSFVSTESFTKGGSYYHALYSPYHLTCT